jgi:uncharacterized cupredoxin-like copper-binding protein
MNKSEIHRQSGASPVQIVAAIAVTIALAIGFYVLAQPGSSGEAETIAGTVTLEQPAADVPDTLEIQVDMVEFGYSPDPIRIPAGRPVRLVVQNVGLVAHELMAGRVVETGSFEYDLFAGVPMQIDGAAMSMDEVDEHADQEAEGAAHEDTEAAHEDAAPAHEDTEEAHEEAAPDEGHGGEDHGSMVLVQPGETSYVTFTIPADRTGEWTAACFLPGHYEAGMHVDLIVE